MLTGLTGAIIGGVAWREQRARSRALLDAAMTQAARLTAAHADRVLEDAAATARLGAELVQQGQLDHPADDRALERFVLAVLHAHPHLTWVSYGDRQNRFLGAWRDPRDNVYLNRSFPIRDGSGSRKTGSFPTVAARPCAAPTITATARPSGHTTASPRPGARRCGPSRTSSTPAAVSASPAAPPSSTCSAASRASSPSISPSTGWRRRSRI